jgi:HK97 family phage major capsid protein
LISVSETVGGSSDCSWIAVVDMSQIAIGRRSEVHVAYLGERWAEYDQTAIRTTSRWAIAPVNEEGIELITGVRA